MTTFRTFLLLVFILCTSKSYSQIYVQDVNINELEDVSLIEVFITGQFNKKVTKISYRINVDYGQAPTAVLYASDTHLATILDSPGGKNVNFNSKMHVLNYFENNGWELIFINSEGRNDRDAKTSFFFKKK